MPIRYELHNGVKPSRYNGNMVLRARQPSKSEGFFGQILTKIVEKQHILTPFSCLTLFPTFSVHLN